MACAERLRALVACAASLALAAGLCAQRDAAKNVLIVVADDLGVDYVGAYREGSAPAPTPTIDALAARGVLFRNAWAYPSCSPARASILTGRYAFRHTVGRWIRYPNNSEPIGTLREREWTLPEVLDRARSGFAHACIGKWHINDVREGLETPRTRGGFGHFTGTMWGQIPSFTSWPRVSGGREATSTVYATTQQTDDALAWIRAQTGPWVCYLAYNAPHKPFHAPPANLHTQKLTGLDPARQPRPFYRAMIEAMDRELGRLLAALGPQLAETDVVFLGDNGSVQQMAVAPFLPARAKGTPYEGGLNVPLIVAGPSVQQGGREVAALACVVDIFATVVELCGAQAAVPAWLELDGVSLAPYLRNPQQAALRQFAFSEEFTGDVWPQPNRNGHACVRDAQHKLIYRPGGMHELYDLVADPWEQRNLLSGSLNNAQMRAYAGLLNEFSRLRNPAARSKVFGAGCATVSAQPRIAARGVPRLGASFDVELTGARAASPAILALGFSDQRFGSLALPLALDVFGGPAGCALGTAPEILVGLVSDAQGMAASRLMVPRVDALTGRGLFATWLTSDGATLLASPSLAAIVGG